MDKLESSTLRMLGELEKFNLGKRRLTNPEPVCKFLNCYVEKGKNLFYLR